MLLVFGVAACVAQWGVRTGDSFYAPPVPARVSATRLPPGIVWPLHNGLANHNLTLPDMVSNTEENQDSGGGCGSCWAWSITTAVEARVAQQKGQLISLSPQQLVDCTHDVPFGGNMGNMANEGCDGGYTEATVEWLKSNRYGMCTHSEYPYTGTEGQCAACTGKVRIDEFEVYPRMVQSAPGVYSETPATEALLAQMVSNGPTVALLSIANQTAFALGDTSDTTCTSTAATGEPPLHSVVVYGYTDTEWLVYNSYGRSWGSEGDGTARIARGSNAYCIGSLKILRISDVTLVDAQQLPTTETRLSVHVYQPTEPHTHASLDDNWSIVTLVSLAVLMLCLLPLCLNPYPTEAHTLRRHQQKYDNQRGRYRFIQIHTIHRPDAPASAPASPPASPPASAPAPAAALLSGGAEAGGEAGAEATVAETETESGVPMAQPTDAADTLKLVTRGTQSYRCNQCSCYIDTLCLYTMNGVSCDSTEYHICVPCGQILSCS